MLAVILGLGSFPGTFTPLSTLTNVFASDDDSTDSTQWDGYDESYIDSMRVTSIRDGSAPFDADNNPGDDADETNGIVRSFDTISYAYSVTMQLKNGRTEPIKRAYMDVEFTLPVTRDVATFEPDLMPYEDGEVTYNDDGTQTYTGRFCMQSESSNAIPGSKDNLKAVVSVMNADNGTVIRPTFRAWMEGNDDDEETGYQPKTTMPDPITVSASAHYYIMINQTGDMNRNLDEALDFTTGNTDASRDPNGENTAWGRYEGYGITLLAENGNLAKGMKGLQLPTKKNADGSNMLTEKGERVMDDISFDLTLSQKVYGENNPSVALYTDQDKGWTPLVWDYYKNERSSTGAWGRPFKYEDYAYGSAPWNKRYTNELSSDVDSVYDGGNWTMTQDPADRMKYHVTINGGAFDPKYVFPETLCSYRNQKRQGVHYSTLKANQAAMTAGGIQMVLRYNQADVTERMTAYLELTADNLVVGGKADPATSKFTANYTLMPPGGMQVATDFTTQKATDHEGDPMEHVDPSDNSSPTRYQTLASAWEDGNAYAFQGQKVRLWGTIWTVNDDPIKTEQMFIKWDDRAFDVDTKVADGQSPNDDIDINSVVGVSGVDGISDVDAYWVGRDHGYYNGDTFDQQNMSDTLATDSDLRFYKSLADLKADGMTLIGMFMNYHCNFRANGSPRANAYVDLIVDPDKTAIGTTYATTMEGYAFIDSYPGAGSVNPMTSADGEKYCTYDSSILYNSQNAAAAKSAPRFMEEAEEEENTEENAENETESVSSDSSSSEVSSVSAPAAEAGESESGNLILEDSETTDAENQTEAENSDSFDTGSADSATTESAPRQAARRTLAKAAPAAADGTDSENKLAKGLMHLAYCSKEKHNEFGEYTYHNINDTKQVLDYQSNIYVKTEYDDEGNMKTGTHYLGPYAGNSLLVVGELTNVTTATATKTRSGSLKKSFDIDEGERTVRFMVQPGVTLEGHLPSDGVEHRTDLYVSSYLPKGKLTYIDQTSTYNLQSIETEVRDTDDQGNPITCRVWNSAKSVYEDVACWKITWTIPSVVVGDPLAPIYFDATIGKQGAEDDVQDMEQLTTTAVINSTYDKRQNNDEFGNRAQTSIRVFRISGVALSKSTSTPLVKNDTDFSYDLTMANTSKIDTRNPVIYDVLPYNHDTRGSLTSSKYNGTYTLNGMTIDFSDAPNALQALADSLKSGVGEDSDEVDLGDGIKIKKNYSFSYKAPDNNTSQLFNYTGNVQSYTAPVSGDYTLEAWGAQGGGTNGGKGGYSEGTIHLEKGQTIYLYVGGQGSQAMQSGFGGNGWNGGGQASYGAYGGGGMTHISTSGTDNLTPNYTTAVREVKLEPGEEVKERHFDTGTEWGTSKWITLDTFRADEDQTIRVTYNANNTCSVSGYEILKKAGDDSWDNMYSKMGVYPSDTRTISVKKGDVIRVNMYFHNSHNTSTPITLKYQHQAITRYETYVEKNESDILDTNNVLLAAGGGGGSTVSRQAKGGVGGGNSRGAYSGQTTIDANGYKPGLGQSSDLLQPNAGAGGGWQGGKTSGSANSGAEGGSGYCSQKLTNANTTSGDTSFQSPTTSSTENGHAGNGAARITLSSVDDLSQKFTAPVDGKYKLEVWGAQGGTNDSYDGNGKGGYSTEVVQLKKGETLYITVGGQGNASGYAGLNGGGRSSRSVSGGGATHIAIEKGLLYSFASKQDQVLIVAGGGGGSARVDPSGHPSMPVGGYAGGLEGGNGSCYWETGSRFLGKGGTQENGGTGETSDASGKFGMGGTIKCNPSAANYWAAGACGGGGWYGGGAAEHAGGGGSGHVITTWNGEAVTSAATTGGNMSMPIPNGAGTEIGHSGNGAAKITFLEQKKSNGFVAVNRSAAIQTSVFDDMKNSETWSGVDIKGECVTTQEIVNNYVSTLLSTKKATISASDLNAALAFRIKLPLLGKGEKVKIHIDLKPTGNQAGNLYVNDFYEDSDNQIDNVQSNPAIVQVYDDLTIVKDWGDDSNVNGERPDKVYVQVYQNGYKYKPTQLVLDSNNGIIDKNGMVTLTKDQADAADANIWKIKLKNVSLYNDSGDMNVYSIKEDTDKLPNHYTEFPSYTYSAECSTCKEAGRSDYTYEMDSAEIMDCPVCGEPLAPHIMKISNSLRDGITLTKLWADGNNADGDRPDHISIYLYQNGKRYKKIVLEKSEAVVYDIQNGEATGSGTKVQTLDAGENTWKLKLSEDMAPRTDKSGNVYTYTIREDTESAEFKKMTSGAHPYSSTPIYSKTGLTVTNRKPTTTNLTVVKLWDDYRNKYGTRPERVQLNILRKSTGAKELYTKITLTAADDSVPVQTWSDRSKDRLQFEKWEQTIYDVPIYDEKGNEYTYSVQEAKSLKGYTAPSYGLKFDYDSYYNADGTVKGTLALKDSFYDNLTAFSDADKQTIAELNYNPTKYKQSTNTSGYIRDYATNAVKNGTRNLTDGSGSPVYRPGNYLVVTNHLSFSPNEKKKFSVVKYWDDAKNHEGKRPTSVNVTIYQDGKVYTDADGNPVTVKLTGSESADSWKTTIKVPRFNVDARDEYVYAIQETENFANYKDDKTYRFLATCTTCGNEFEIGTANGNVENDLLGKGTLQREFKCPICGSYNSINSSTTTSQAVLSVTNTNIAKKEILVTKAWDDSANARSLRPTSVSFRLYQRQGNNGAWKPYSFVDGDTITLTEADKTTIANGKPGYEYWQKAVKVPATYADGTTAVYRVDEVKIPDYYYMNRGTNTDQTKAEFLSQESTDLNQNTLTVTNHLNLIHVRKIWDDQHNVAGLRPDAVSLLLKQNGTKYQTVKLTAKDALTAAEKKAAGISDELDVWDKEVPVSSVDENGKAYTYTVEEPTVPSPYTLESTSSDAKTGIYSVTNLGTSSLTIRKTTKGPGADEDNTAFTFTVTLTQPGSTKAYTGRTLKLYKNGSTTGEDIQTDANGTCTVSLKSGESAKIDFIPIGTGYTISEDGKQAEYYTTSYTSDKQTTETSLQDNSRTVTGTVAPKDASFVAFTNTHKTVNLGLYKKVTGSLADPNRLFDFKVVLTYGGKPYANRKVTVDGYKDKELTTDANGTVTLKLKHGDHVYLHDIPMNAGYTVTESHSGYKSIPEGDPQSAEHLLKDADTGFTNERDGAKVTKTVNRSSNFVGQKETWTATGTIPKDISANAEDNFHYRFQDTFDSRLSYQGLEEVYLITGNAGNGTHVALSTSEYKETIEGQKVTVELTKAGLQRAEDLVKNADTWMIVRYNTTIKKEAKPGEHIENTVYLQYGGYEDSKDPNDPNHHDPNRPEEENPDKPYVYTSDIEVHKKDMDNGTDLAGAKCQLLDASGQPIRIGKDGTVYTAAQNGYNAAEDYIMKTGADGKARFHGLQTGTYYLKEIQTPAHYTLLADSIKVVLEEDQAKGSVDTVSLRVDENGNVTIMTGGNGIYKYWMISLLAMAGVLAGVLAKKRRKKSRRIEN